MAKKENQGGSRNRIKAISTMFTIVDGLRELETAGVSELADHLDMPSSTVHIYLKTLEEEGFVLNDDGQYRSSLRFLELGGDIRQRMSIFRTVRPQVDELSAQTNEVANLGIEEDGKRVLLYTSEPSEGVFDNSPVGQYTHMHWTALGKALLAQLPDQRIHDIVDRHGLPEATDRTITDRETLFERIETIRDRGFSIEDEERRRGIKALAVPIQYDSNPSPPAAVSISGPKRRIGEESYDGLLDAIKNAVNVSELRYKHYQ
ncbi:IclR family transcriptional regulator [Halobellus rubicundus]|uniref:IclR family transcriptional regulator n=1 Tax=Halobellus rubicundus TaxID=2996466 RepID=A0ABD5MA98_9EURY